MAVKMDQQVDDHYDVVIIGAGLSGINAAYRVQEALPHMKYTILEARDVIGGTWSFFKYPGIRSDSEIASFAFSWEPWSQEKSLADAASIVQYLDQTSSKHGIDKHTQFHTRVTKLDWRSNIQKWTLTATRTNPSKASESKTFHTRFVIMCTGYYDYATAYQAVIPGIGNFKGKTVHPQFWPADLDWTDKKIVIIGSGATAATILPAMSEKAKHVTMLQRSPSHFLVVPSIEPIDMFIRRWVSPSLAYSVIRIRILIITFLVVALCRIMPNAVTKFLRKGVKSELPEGYPIEPHFVPKYAPFTQRVCITPDGDFFKAIRDGKADVETGEIETLDDKSIILKSGHKIEDVDVIITATGLQLSLIGGIKPHVDGKLVHLNDKFVWRNTCLQDVPNLCFLIGYIDNAWTLGSDSSSMLFVRLIKEMEKTRNTSFVATMSEGEKKSISQVPIMNLSSGYVQRSKDALPRTGNKAPWRPRWHYFQDYWFAGYGNIEKGMKMVKVDTKG